MWHKVISNIILLCFIPSLGAPTNIYEDKVAVFANVFLKDYAKSVNHFEKSYQLWVGIKNSTTTINRRGDLERQQFELTDRAFRDLLLKDTQWQNLKNQVESLP